jgi:aspartate-semialdehyde dehydrogenase
MKRRVCCAQDVGWCSPARSPRWLARWLAVDVAGSDAVHVSRLRCDVGGSGRLAFWLAFDDIRKGIALNLVSTLEIALRELA